MTLPKWVYGLTFVLVAGAGVAQADLIVKPIGATTTSTFSGTSFIEQTINASGLSFDLTTGQTAPAAGSWPTHGVAGHTGDSSLSSNTQTLTIVYDLGAVYNLGDFRLWNYNEHTGAGPAMGRGVQTATIKYSTDNSTFLTAQSNAAFTIAPGTTTYQGDPYSYLTGKQARWVEFDVTANFNGVGSADNFTGISEIRFTSVPEPASLGMLCVAGLGLLSRRKR